MQALEGQPVEFTFQHYSPLIESVKVNRLVCVAVHILSTINFVDRVLVVQIMEHKFVKKEAKRVRRSKLYYVRNWPATRFTIP